MSFIQEKDGDLYLDVNKWVKHQECLHEQYKREEQVKQIRWERIQNLILHLLYMAKAINNKDMEKYLLELRRLV